MRPFPVVAALLLAGCATASAPPPAGTPLEALAARLPAAAEGFTRGDVVWHERERPGMGITVEYAGPSRSAVATVSLYDRGRPAIPAEPYGADIQAEFAAAVAEETTGLDSRSMAERDRRELPVPGQPGLSCARLQGSYGRQQVQTLVCVGGAAGRFLRVQVTSPARQLRPVDPMPFVVGIAQAVRG